jgi:hypothetical protein
MRRSDLVERLADPIFAHTLECFIDRLIKDRVIVVDKKTGELRENDDF